MNSRPIVDHYWLQTDQNLTAFMEGLNRRSRSKESNHNIGGWEALYARARARGGGSGGCWGRGPWRHCSVANASADGAAEDGAGKRRRWTPVKRPFSESGPCSSSRAYRRAFLPPRHSHRRLVSSSSVSSVPGRAAHRLRLLSVSGRGADVSAAKRSIWDGFIQVSAVHTFCEPVRSPPQSAWMKTITVSGFFFFSCSSHRFAPPPSSVRLGWMDGWTDVRQGTQRFLRTRMVFFLQKKKCSWRQKRSCWIKSLVGFRQGFLKRHERKKAAVSTTPDLIDPHATPSSPHDTYVKIPQMTVYNPVVNKDDLKHLMYFRVIKHLHFTLWCQDNSGGNTGPQSSVIYC